MPIKPWVDKLRNPPKQYQRGWCEFYKLKFKLTPDVLIPRPETEILVDETLRLEKRSKLKTYNSTFTVVDVGTGSGCIAISIAKNSPSTKVFGLDISEAALKVAEQNAKLNHVENQVIFLQSDLLSAIIPSDTLVTRGTHGTSNIDVIVTNLPYIPSSKLMLIDPMVRDFEPSLALDGGRDGLELYRKLFQQIKQVFNVSDANQKGERSMVFIGEIDEDQGDLISQEAKSYFPRAEVEIKKDLAKKDRMLVVKF